MDGGIRSTSYRYLVGLMLLIRRRICGECIRRKFLTRHKCVNNINLELELVTGIQMKSRAQSSLTNTHAHVHIHTK